MAVRVALLAQASAEAAKRRFGAPPIPDREEDTPDEDPEPEEADDPATEEREDDVDLSQRMALDLEDKHGRLAMSTPVCPCDPERVSDPAQH